MAVVKKVTSALMCPSKSTPRRQSLEAKRSEVMEEREQRRRGECKDPGTLHIYTTGFQCCGSIRALERTKDRPQAP